MCRKMTVSLSCVEDNIMLIAPWMLMRRYSHACQKLTSSFSDSQSYIEKTFDIRTPFLMDGEAKKIAAALILDEPITLDEFFKTKEKTSKPTYFLEDKKCPNLIIERFIEFKRNLKFCELFKFVPASDDYNDNNSFVRHLVEKVLDLTNFDTSDLKGCNESEEFVILEYNKQRFLIPPRSSYICGNIFDLPMYFKNEAFDFIVLDPPWPNKHVRRRKKARGSAYGYDMLTVSELMKLPLKSILSPKAIVLIWITNSSDINTEFQNSLSVWDLELVTTWYWIKLTKSGHPVVHSSITQSRGKQPYEKILVARKRGIEEKCSKVIPKELLLVSIPSGIHSHKPYLNDVLSETLGLNSQDKCLEIFARNLLPGWTSFGLEALKFQNIAVL